MGLFDFGGGGGGNKGFDSQSYRDDYDKISFAFDQLLEKRREVMDNYEDISTKALDNLIGMTAPAAREMFRASSDYLDRYSKDIAPAISRYMKDAEGYDTPMRREQERAGAMADVREAGDAAREQSMAALERYGIDPSQVRSGALDANLRLGTALGQVQAGNKAAKDVEERGFELRRGAIQQGGQLYDAGNSAAQTGTGLLQTGVSAANQTAATYGQLAGTVPGLIEAKRGIITNKLNAKIAETQSKQASEGGSPMAAIGQTVGMIGGGIAGWYATGGTPVGAMAGASIGGAAGSQL